MKKILLSTAILFLSLLQSLMAQCVIDTTINDLVVPPAGSTFDTLPNGEPIVILPYGQENVMYSEVLRFKVPKDTTYLGIAGTVDSIRLISVMNLPNGLNMTCNPSNCVFLGDSFGCAEMGGIPVGPDSLELRVAIEYTVSIGAASAPIKDTLGGFYLIIRKALSTSEDAVRKVQPKVYPNPANGYIKLDMSGMLARTAEITIINMVGNVVHQEQWTSPFTSAQQLNVAKLVPGVYLYQVEAEGARYTGRFSIARP